MSHHARAHPDDPYTYVTWAGGHIKCRPVMPHFAAAVAETVPLPDPPTYLTRKDLAGNQSEHPLDETMVYPVTAPRTSSGELLIFPDVLRMNTLPMRTALLAYEKDKARTIEEWEARPEEHAEQLKRHKEWQEWRTLYMEVRRERNEKVARFVLLKGAQIDVPQGWDNLYREAGIEVPDDPAELKLFYLSHELLNGVAEESEFIEFLFSLGQVQRDVQEGAIRDAEATFRYQVRSDEAANGVDPERDPQKAQKR